MKRLEERLADTEIVTLYPYSVTNRVLTGQRVFAKVWRWILARKLSGEAAVGLINVRNVWQVVVPADRRYGPLYNGRHL